MLQHPGATFPGEDEIAEDADRLCRRPPEWTVSTSDGQIATSGRVYLIEVKSAGTSGLAYRVSARSARNGATLWTAPLDGVDVGRFDLALGTDTLYVLPLGANRAAAVVHAIPVT